MDVVEWVLTIAILAALYVYMTAPKLGRRGRLPGDGKKACFFAHRGLHDQERGIPENSLGAFERAAARGYGMELDVRLTKDQVPVVFHDSTLERMCGIDRRLEDCTWEELQAYRLQGTEYGIPSLEQVLAAVRGRTPLLVELKMDGSDASVCIHADRLLQKYQGPYMVESFHPFALYWYRHNRPEVLRGQLSSDFRRDRSLRLMAPHFAGRHLLFNFFAKPDFIAYDCEARKGLSLFLCRKVFRAPVAAWTVRSEEQLFRAQRDCQMYIFERFCP